MPDRKFTREDIETLCKLIEAEGASKERARIRRELLAWADVASRQFSMEGCVVEHDEFLEALNRICPEEG